MQLNFDNAINFENSSNFISSYFVLFSLIVIHMNSFAFLYLSSSSQKQSNPPINITNKNNSMSTVP